MTGSPTDRAEPTGSAAESVLLQRHALPDTTVDGVIEPTLTSADLTAREIADSLWLVRAIAGTDVEDAARPQPRDPPDLDARPPGPRDVDTGLDQRSTDRREDWKLGDQRSVRPSTAEFDVPEVSAPLVWPTAPTLANPLLIARALRPAALTEKSPWHRELDEEATAAAAAQTRSWLPRWRPAPWHRFEVAFVVDDSLSMEIWQHTVREFRDVLLRQGAFRDVRTYRLDCSIPVAKKLLLRTEAGAARSWRDLLDPTHRRLVLVITDTVGAAWHSGAAGALLAAWGRSMPVALLQVMPERLWHWGGLSARRMRLSAPEPGAPNARLSVSAVQPVYGPVPAPRNGDVVIPVLALEQSWLHSWARLFAVVGAGPINLTATFVSPTATEEPEPASDDDPPPSPKERVRRFRAFASVEAFHLAGLLAVAPLSLATISQVQRVLLPGAGVDTQAEVLLGGLLQRRSPIGPAGISFDFVDGVREELLIGLYRSDVVRVARLVSDHLGGRIPSLRNFRRALEDPNGTELPVINPDDRPLVKLQAAVFKALSGPYSRRGKAIRRKLDADPASVTPEGHVDNDPQSDAAASTQERSASTRPPETEDSLSTEVHHAPPPEETQGPQEGADMSAPGRMTELGRPRPVDITPTVKGQPRIWGDVVPLRNPDFVGREDLLKQLRQRLAEPGATAVLPEALHGLGGVGKSQTVVEYIYRHADDYDLVWWIAAEHPTGIRNSFVELARKLEIPTAGDADNVQRAVLEALRKGEPYSRWILVFDNADRPDSIKNFLPRTTGATGHVVVTSRNSQWGNVARSVEIDLFTRRESIELLHRRGGEITDADADRLAEALGDLPLAIEQAATWRAQTGMPVWEYLELLEENRAELLALGTASEDQLPVAAAWNVPLSQLRNEHPEALALLQICAFFGPEPISRRVFSGVPEARVPESQHELRSALSDPIKLNSSIREINRYSLAKIDHRSNTLQLHRLVQAVLKNRVPEDQRGDMQHVAHVLLVNGDPNDPDNTAYWPRYAELLPHAITTDAMSCRASWVRGLMINLVRYLMNIGDYESGRELSGQAWRIWRDEIGERDLQTLTMARHYGLILRRQQKFQEARELNRRTYDLMLSEYGEDHEAMLSVAEAVAMDLRGEGRFVEELAMRQDVYERATRTLGADDPQTLNFGFGLSGSLRALGEYFRARDLDEDIYRRRLLVHGPDHSRTFQSLDGIAMDLRECGLYLEAVRIGQDSLAKQREILGRDHLRVVGALRNVSVARRKAGDPAGALEASEECHDLYSQRQGDLHLDTITALMNMAVDLRQLGDLSRAREHGERARQQYLEVYGPNHPYAHIAGTNLSATLRLLGDTDGARTLDDAAYAFYRSAFGADHPAALVMATNLASDLAALGDATTAYTMDSDTFERSRRVLGDEHPSTLAVLLNLSLDLTSLGRTDEAAALHDTALVGFRARLGDDHPATTAAIQKVRANCDTDTMQL